MRLTLLPGATGAVDAMDVVLHAGRHVVVDHHVSPSSSSLEQPRSAG